MPPLSYAMDYKTTLELTFSTWIHESIIYQMLINTNYMPSGKVKERAP